MSGTLVIAETRRGELRGITLELLGAASALAQAGCGPVRIGVISRDPGQYVDALNVEGVEEILTVDSPTEHFEAHIHTESVEALIAETQPSVVLAGHTIDSMGFAPAVAAEMGLGFATDVTSIEWRDDGPIVQRGDYGDHLLATLEFAAGTAVLLTVRQGAFDPPAAGSGQASARPASNPADPAAAATEHLGFREAAAGDVDITQSDFLISIGRGVEDESDVQRFLDLADTLGATLSASRPLVDAGWLPASRQVGQSGRTVQPKVYLALGISGAVQHLMGMRGSETIIAVNTDPEAPIFGIADFGAAADLNEVSEALAAQFASS
jgi:electron transfer flavoprotein alpha subunit